MKKLLSVAGVRRMYEGLYERSPREASSNRGLRMISAARWVLRSPLIALTWLVVITHGNAQQYEVIVRNFESSTSIQTALDRYSERIVDDSFNGVSQLCAEDIDGDGKMDIVGAAEDADEICWWKNTDGGTNWTKRTVAMAFNGARSVYVADVNDDSFLDILGAAYIADDIAWWQNVDGSGTNWIAHTVDGTFNGASSVYGADIDGDGNTDVVGAAYDADDIAWWQNVDGSGTNWVKHIVDSAFDGARAVCVAYVNSDGFADIIGAAYNADDITWWQNVDGSGTNWIEHTVNSFFNGANSIYAADVNSDGFEDILATSYFADSIVWWENNDGSGASWTARTIANSFDGANAVCAADLDGDGYLEVLGASANGDSITWWHNLDGTGVSWSEYQITSAFDGASSVCTADLNSDGDLDILGAAKNADGVAWWADSAVADFYPPVWMNMLDASPSLTAIASESAEWGDSSTRFTCTGWSRTGSAPSSGSGFDTGFFSLTADTVIEFNWHTQHWLEASATTYGSVVTSNGWHTAGTDTALAAIPDPLCRFDGWSGDVPSADTNNLTLLLAMDQPRTAVAHFVLPQYEVVVSNRYAVTVIHTALNGIMTKTTVDGNFLWTESAHAADMDGDGDLDVLGASPFDGLSWWENANGTGTNWIKHTVSIYLDQARSIQGADMDGDGDTDLLAAFSQSGTVVWIENVNGVGTELSNHVVDGDFAGTYSVYAADIDGDGDTDVAGAARDADDIAWWENVHGTANNWTKHTINNSYDGARAVYVQDMDGDGDMDILGTSQYSCRVSWWENTDGSGQAWAEHTVDSWYLMAYSIYAADIDGDGDMDILAPSSYSDDISWWENLDGFAKSWKKHTVDSFDGAYSAYSADIDADGDMDVLGAAENADVIAWWENTDGSGTDWTKHIVDGSFDRTRSVCAADINGDGSLDILGAARGANDIVWWRNDSSVLATFHAPAWTNTLDAATNLVVSMTNGVAWDNGLTQLVCRGWIRTGSDPDSGPGGYTGHFDLTNDAVIAFYWGTNVLLQYSLVGNGSIEGEGEGWHPLGETATATGVAAPYYSWAGWTGDLPTTMNPLTFTNDRALILCANFSENQAIHGTPEWWLAAHGWSNNFDAAAADDSDGDGLLTWEEWHVDTNPTNAVSVLKVTGVNPVSNGVLVTWQGGVKAWQYLQVRGGLSSTSEQWSMCCTNAPPTSGTTNWLHQVPSTNALFYRLKAHR